MLLGLASSALHAQQDLEGSVPSNWTASSGALSISPDHYKLGFQSLRWDWNGC
jgi:chondroitin-sulfate-ABC endolyase/exolyase